MGEVRLDWCVGFGMCVRRGRTMHGIGVPREDVIIER